MRNSRFFVVATLVLLNVSLCTVALGQDEATAQEVVAKVKEAAAPYRRRGT